MSINLKSVNLTNGSKALKLESPYHPDLPARLRKLGGKWNGDRRAWYMPSDLEKEVRALCFEFYGLDPLAEQSAGVVNVKIDISDSSFYQDYWLFGRQILRRIARDADVRPGEGVSILSGGFARSGGSRNNPRIGDAQDNTVLLIRNVPRHMAEQYNLDNSNSPAEIIETQPNE